ncbi:MAG TPA: hypothetical protein VHS58_00545 [Acetobacteraceae bacterium]|jgi:hypothetical protein|nr:hypothetical protein [Acetobacteraceae bacterium]
MFKLLLTAAAFAGLAIAAAQVATAAPPSGQTAYDASAAIGPIDASTFSDHSKYPLHRHSFADQSKYPLHRSSYFEPGASDVQYRAGGTDTRG